MKTYRVRYWPKDHGHSYLTTYAKAASTSEAEQQVRTKHPGCNIKETHLWNEAIPSNHMSTKSQPSADTPRTTITRKIGSNRDKARLWIEGSALTSQDWKPGKQFVPVWSKGCLGYLATTVPLTGQTLRKVAGTTDRPIIDTNTDKILDYLEAEIGDTVTITITEEVITITKADA